MNRVLMKLFKTSNIEIISEYRNFFGIELPSVQLVKTFWEMFLQCEPVSWLDRVNQLSVFTFCTYFVFSLHLSMFDVCLLMFFVF